MKYFILNGTFKEGHPEGPAFKAALDAHHAYTAEYIKNGDILNCGPKPSGGGVIIIRAESVDAIEKIIANDPFVTAGVQDYTIQEFNVFAIQDYAKEWK